MRGTAVPLSHVIPIVKAKVGGDILDVKVKHLVSGVMVYDITVLTVEGRYRSVVVDAERNRIIGMGRD